MTFYSKYIKRLLDIVISILGLGLSVIFVFIAVVAIYLEDPGPVVFKQKRIGKDKSYFYIHKLRSMRMDTPDIPTHMLKNPEKYILKTGLVIRKLSIDELPQLWDILVGKMSLIGPRPALWNQDDLIEERDKYNVHSVRPGLTGWAQINGRDELSIEDKARLDGEYVQRLRNNSLSGFLMDIKCFFGTITAVLGQKGVVEGGPGGK